MKRGINDMNIRMVIMTKSSKFGQYCVAGINCDTGKWVRLVSTDKTTHGAITFGDLQFENGNCAQALDVVDVMIERYDNNPAQPENAIIDRAYYMQYLKSISIEDAIALYKDSEPMLILGNTSYRIEEGMVPLLGRSLSLVVVKDLCFAQQVNDEGKPKTKVSFLYSGTLYTNMSVTDSRFYDIEDGAEFEKAAIVVSVGTPYNGNCYKFVAAIYIL